jgi:hypothetical protein
MVMLDAVDAVLDDVKLTTLAFAIAIGWSVYQVGVGLAQLVDGLLAHLPGDQSFGPQGALTWVVGHRVVSLDSLLTGLIELGVALAAAAFVRRRYGFGRVDD